MELQEMASRELIDEMRQERAEFVTKFESLHWIPVYSVTVQDLYPGSRWEVRVSSL